MWKKRFYVALILVMFLNVEMAGASTGPSPRMGHRMIYDPVNKRAILFGGSLWDQGASRYTFYNDLWSYDVEDGTWTEIETGLKPPGRFNHMMAYISETHQIVLFGGFTSQDRIGDTWIYDIDGNTWTRVDTDVAPSPRSDAAFCYDPRYGVAILFDGYGLNDDHPNDTWVFNVTSHHWTRKSPEASPKPQYGHYMVFDTVNQKAIMYGGHWSYGGGAHGYSDGVWTYDYQTDTWTKVDDATALPSRYWHSLAYDSDRGKMVVFGGSGEKQTASTTHGSTTTRQTRGRRSTSQCTHPGERTRTWSTTRSQGEQFYLEAFASGVRTLSTTYGFWTRRSLLGRR